MYDFLNKFAYRTTVKHRKTAICDCHCTVVSLDLGSMAWLQYSKYPYSAVFCTAVAVYGTVESPTSGSAQYMTQMCQNVASGSNSLGKSII